MHLTQVKSVVGGITTAAVLGYAYVGANPPFSLDAGAYLVPKNAVVFPQAYDPNPYYEVITNEAKVRGQIETIHGFVSLLIENIEHLSPEFSKTVDEHFWELV